MTSPDTPAGIPGDVTVIPAPAPLDAAATATAAAEALISARAAGIPQPDYIHLSPGPSPAASLQFTTTRPPAVVWDALREWARYAGTTVTATENRSRAGTYNASVKWTAEGIQFEAWSTINAAPPDQDTTP